MTKRNDVEFAYDSSQCTKSRERLNPIMNEHPYMHRTVKVLGEITKCSMHFGARPIVVGGQAVEVYTFGHYTTVDVDLVADDEVVERVLRDLGFHKQKGHRHWYHQELQIPIEIVDSNLNGSQDMLTVVEVDNLEIYIIGVEDLIIDRVRASVRWDSLSDLEMSEILTDAYKAMINLEYIDTILSSGDDSASDVWKNIKTQFELT